MDKIWPYFLPLLPLGWWSLSLAEALDPVVARSLIGVFVLLATWRPGDRPGCSSGHIRTGPGRVCLRELAGAFVVPLSCGGWRHLARDSGSGACERGLVCTDLPIRPDDGCAATGDTFFSHLWRRLNEDDADVRGAGAGWEAILRGRTAAVKFLDLLVSGRRI